MFLEIYNKLPDFEKKSLWNEFSVSSLEKNKRVHNLIMGENYA